MNNGSMKRLSDKFNEEVNNKTERKSSVDPTIENTFTGLLKSSIKKREEFSKKSHNISEDKDASYEKDFMDTLQESHKELFKEMLNEEFGFIYYPGLRYHDGKYFTELQRDLYNIRYYDTKSDFLDSIYNEETEISLSELINGVKSRVRSILSKKQK